MDTGYGMERRRGVLLIEERRHDVASFVLDCDGQPRPQPTTRKRGLEFGIRVNQFYRLDQMHGVTGF